MSVRMLDYYDVACDYPACTVNTAEVGGDYSAMADADSAREDWTYGDGQELEYSVKRRTWLPPEPSFARWLPLIVQVHLCSEHRVSVPDDLAEEL